MILSIINLLYEKALESIIDQQLSAIIVKGNKILSKPYCNIPCTKLKNITVSSIHAETNTIINYFGKSFYFDKEGNLIYNSNELLKKRRKINIFVIRINKNGDICNARPCNDCLNIMKCVGIRKVFYSVSKDNIICENVKDMISIHISSVKRQQIIYNSNTDDILKYYENLLKKYFPLSIKEKNLDNFIKYNLMTILPDYKYEFIVDNIKRYIIIINLNNIVIVKAEII